MSKIIQNHFIFIVCFYTEIDNLELSYCRPGLKIYFKQTEIQGSD